MRQYYVFFTAVTILSSGIFGWSGVPATKERKGESRGMQSHNVHYFSEYVTREQASKDVLNMLFENEYLIIDFYADWCNPCKRLGEAFESISPDFLNVLVVKVNVEQYKELAALYNVRSLPTVLFFKRGTLVHKLIGFEGTGALRSLVGSLYK